jgi:hypothetical protein
MSASATAARRLGAISTALGDAAPPAPAAAAAKGRPARPAAEPAAAASTATLRLGAFDLCPESLLAEQLPALAEKYGGFYEIWLQLFEHARASSTSVDLGGVALGEVELVRYSPVDGHYPTAEELATLVRETPSLREGAVSRCKKPPIVLPRQALKRRFLSAAGRYRDLRQRRGLMERHAVAG